MKSRNRPIGRRQFLREGLRSSGVLAAGAAILGASKKILEAGDQQRPISPFAYNIEALKKTDPSLIKYEQAGAFAIRNPKPRRIAAGPQDRLYVAAENSIVVIEPDGAQVSEIVCPAAVQSVAVWRDGTIYAGLRDHIEVFRSDGQRLAAWESPGKKTWLTGLAVAENDVFAADAGNRVLLRYDKSGKLIHRLGEKNRERNIPGFIVPSPYLDVELGRDGLLRVNNTGRHQVEMYTFDGDFEGAWGKAGNAIDSFCGCCNPIGIAVLPDGRMVTCEKGLPRVKVYSAEGVFDSVVAGPESFPENARACSDLNDCTHGGMDAAVDSKGRIYILDFVTAQVRVMKHKTAA